MNSLFARTILGFLALLTILAMVIFVPAGTVNFWQGWLCLAVFMGCAALITVYLARYDRALLASRVSAGPTAETRPVQKMIQALASLGFVLLFIVPGLDHRFGWSHLSEVIVFTADALIVLGFIVVFFVFRANSFTSATIEVKQEQRVISNGPYRIVRHPMYAGAILICIFIPLALGSWIGVPCVLPLMAAIVARMGDEEQFLSQNLPGYAAYLKRVPYRLLPGVW